MFLFIVGAEFVDNYFGEALNTAGNVIGGVVDFVGKKDIRMSNNFMLKVFSV